MEAEKAVSRLIAIMDTERAVSSWLLWTLKRLFLVGVRGN